jgi:hypothetical protein
MKISRDIIHKINPKSKDVNKDIDKSNGMTSAVRLKGISEQERQQLRIPSYKYILP